jgi:hypothetical protein
MPVRLHHFRNCPQIEQHFLNKELLNGVGNRYVRVQKGCRVSEPPTSEHAIYDEFAFKNRCADLFDVQVERIKQRRLMADRCV